MPGLRTETGDGPATWEKKRAQRDIGANTWIWESPVSDESLPHLVSRLAAWGFDLVELPIENLGDWNPARTAALLQEHGLSASICIAMAPGRELCAADRDAVEATQAFLRSSIDVAVTIGSAVIAGPIYASVGRTWRMSGPERADLYTSLREALRPVCEYGAERGVRVAIEPLVRYETSVINTVDQALEVIDGLPEEGCGLLIDSYHANVEEPDVPAAFRKAGDRLAHRPPLRQRPWRAGRRSHGLERNPGCARCNRLPRRARHRNLHRRQRGDRDRRVRLASAGLVAEDEIARQGIAHLRKVFGSR